MRSKKMKIIRRKSLGDRARGLLTIALITIMFILGGCTGPVFDAFTTGGSSGAPSKGASLSGDGEVVFDMYVMSQCPYGLQVENAMIPVKEKMGDALDLRINYIADDVGNGQFKALHGQPEVDGNIVQLCAAKHNPDKYLKLIECMNVNPRTIPDNWEQCSQQNELNTDAIKTCFEGEEGKDLLRESIKLANEAGARASPTMFINGEPYSGGRDTLAFQRAVCGALNGEHEACENMPACVQDTDCTAEPSKIGSCTNPNTKGAKCVYTDPVKVEAKVLSDEKCNSCNTEAIMGQLSQLFKGLETKVVDINTAEGKQLAEMLDVTVLPVYFFDSKITETASWKSNPNLVNAFDNVAGGYKIKDQVSGAKWFVDETKRAEMLKDIGVTLGDNRPQIDFFVMSYCPFGNQAEEGVKGAYDLLKDHADFNPRWVIYSNYRGGGPEFCLEGHDELCSMHGVVELNQNIREECVKMEYDMDKWFDFALAMNKDCNYENADTCWTGTATKLGLDTKKIQSCFDANKVKIATRDKSLGDKLGVQGSPTVFIDGEEYNGPRTGQGYAAALCAAFDGQKPAVCNDIPDLPAATAQAAPAAMGAGCGV